MELSTLPHSIKQLSAPDWASQAMHDLKDMIVPKAQGIYEWELLLECGISISISNGRGRIEQWPTQTFSPHQF